MPTSPSLLKDTRYTGTGSLLRIWSFTQCYVLKNLKMKKLSIKLEKKSEDKKDKKNYLRREFSYASYQQSIPSADIIKKS